MSGEYKGAFLKVDITPNVSPENPAYLQGMSGKLRASTAVAVPLSMEMCMLEDDRYTRLLFVTADIFGFDRTVVESVRQHAFLWGMGPEHIVLSASHTHYAPGTVAGLHESLGPYYQNYSHQLSDIIISALDSLYERLEPCVINAGQAVARIGVNRRVVMGKDIQFGPNPDGAYIRETPILKLSLNSSRQTILWVNHGCHPTGMGADTRISADYPGIMKQTLVQGRVADGVMFFQGAAGTCKATSRHSESSAFSNCLADVRQNGQHLATAVEDALNHDLRPITGPFTCARRQIVLPLKPDARVKTGSLTTETQMIGLGGGLRLLSFPMEPAAELAGQMTGLEGFSKHDFLLGYTNGLQGYLPTDRMIEDGGYETRQSHLVYQIPAALDQGTEKRVVESVEELLSFQKRAEGGSQPQAPVRNTDTQKAFFVLSAGRCGTMTLAHLLNTATNAWVWHHPQPDPIRAALLAWWKKIDLAETFWRTRLPVIQRCWSQNLIHGETDMLMTPFAEAIASEIPRSKFIILVRDPHDFVRSGMRRNYYRGHDWDIGRLRPRENSPDNRQWAALNQFEKVCWLWNETYLRILRMTEGLPEDRKRIVKFEDLVSQPQTTRDLFTFLELDGYDEKQINAVLSKKLNAQTAGHFRPPNQWSADLRAGAQKHCKEMSAVFGYSLAPSSLPAETQPPVSADTVPGRPNLLFLEQSYQSTGGHLDHVVPSLETEYNVKYLKTLDIRKSRQAIDWADIVWLEWANQLTIQATNHIPEISDKKVICRLHGYEVFTDMPAKINWERVHRLIFVANHKKKIFDRKFDQPNLIRTVIRNGVDIDRFSIPENKTNTKKLVLLGHLNFRKGLPVLLHFYRLLLKQDPSYFLYIRGEFQDPRLEMAARTMIEEMELDEKIEFVDWVDDLNAWFADKSHILSFSLEESFHYAIGNGMAAGLKPVIHAWNESRDIWPQDYIFKDLDQFLSLVLDDAFEPQRYRQTLFDRGLTANRQVDQIKTVLRELTNSDAGRPIMRTISKPDPPSADALEKTDSNPPETPTVTSPSHPDHMAAPYQPDASREISPSDFSNRNDLGLWLHQAETIKPYMNLEYVLKKQSASFGEVELVYFLQNAFHRMCTSYFNYGQIAAYDYKLSEWLTNMLVRESGPAGDLKTTSKSALLTRLFGILKARLPDSKKATCIEIKRVFKNADDTGGIRDARATRIYGCLQQSLGELFDRRLCSLFVVHGSMSTLDYTRFSDIDTQLFLTDEVFSSEENIDAAARIISAATQTLKIFDPLQHHGYFIATDMDRASYPQAYLPFETLACGTILFGESHQLFHERPSGHENQMAVWNIASFFRKSAIEKYVPASPFDMKRYLSRFSMLPVLYLELFQDLYPYKREAFSLAKPFFPSELWEAYEIVSQVRKRWNPNQRIKFSQRFFDRVWAVAEMMLTFLREQTGE